MIEKKIKKFSLYLLAVLVFTIASTVLFYMQSLGFFDNRKKLELTIEEKQWIAEHNGSITVSGDPNYPPVDFIDEEGNPEGISEDFLMEIESVLSMKFIRVNSSDWDESLKKSFEKKIDIIKGVAITLDRTKYLLFTQPYIEYPTVLIVNTDVTKTLTLADLNNKRVAITQGYATVDYISKNYSNIIIVPVKNDKIALTMVSMKEVDAAVSDLPTASYLIGKLSFSNLRVAGETGFSYRLAFGSRKDWPILNQILTKAVDSINANKKEKIIRKWITIDYNRFLFSGKFWLMCGIIGGVIIFSFLFYKLWNHSLLILVQERTRELNDYKIRLESIVEERTSALKKSNFELVRALNEVKTLTGFLPICSSCKKIRDDKGYWNQIEKYISDHTDAEFSHSLCPECMQKQYPELALKLKKPLE